jgi:hypothetical protein
MSSVRCSWDLHFVGTSFLMEIYVEMCNLKNDVSSQKADKDVRCSFSVPQENDIPILFLKRK